MTDKEFEEHLVLCLKNNPELLFPILDKHLTIKAEISKYHNYSDPPSRISLYFMDKLIDYAVIRNEN